MKKRVKPQGIPRHVDRLYKAVENYIKKTGGSVAVIGGIEIQEEVGAFRYRVAIRCTGKLPTFAKDGQDTNTPASGGTA